MYYKFIVLFACLLLQSCSDKPANTVRNIPPYGIIMSPVFESRRGINGFYWIVYAGDPVNIQYAVLGDGRHIINGISEGSFSMYDREANEAWLLKLPVHSQVYVNADRTFQILTNFVSVANNGDFFFQDTGDENLKRVIVTFEKYQGSK